MVRPQNAVFFMEETVLPETNKPLMLKAVLACPILTWMSNSLLANGVQRFFIVCAPQFADDVRACFPAGTEVIISEQQSDLMSFLNTPDPVLVLNRSAIPMAEAGPGFAYAAAGYELQEAWREKLTNAVQGAELVAGWLPVYGPDTLAELEPLLQAREQKA